MNFSVLDPALTTALTFAPPTLSWKARGQLRLGGSVIDIQCSIMWPLVRAWASPSCCNYQRQGYYITYSSSRTLALESCEEQLQNGTHTVTYLELAPVTRSILSPE